MLVLFSAAGGAAAAIAAIIIGFCCWRRKKKAQSTAPSKRDMGAAVPKPESPDSPAKNATFEALDHSDGEGKVYSLLMSECMHGCMHGWGVFWGGFWRGGPVDLCRVWVDAYVAVVEDSVGFEEFCFWSYCHIAPI